MAATFSVFIRTIIKNEVDFGVFERYIDVYCVFVLGRQDDVSKKIILFLEDEQELLDTVGQVLNENGYEVIGMTTAEEALQRLQKLSPDLILADIKLPGIDGFDFYKAVRQIAHCKDTPFVYLTAFNDLQAAITAKEEGAAEYITKPFDFEYLVFRLKSIVPVS